MTNEPTLIELLHTLYSSDFSFFVYTYTLLLFGSCHNAAVVKTVTVSSASHCQMKNERDNYRNWTNQAGHKAKIRIQSK